MIVLSEDTRKKLTDKLEKLWPLVKGFIDIDRNNRFSNVASSIWFACKSLKSAATYSYAKLEIYSMQVMSNNLWLDISTCIEKIKNNTFDDTPDIVANNINEISKIYLEYKNILDKEIKESEEAAKRIVVHPVIKNFLPHLRNLTNLAEDFAHDEKIEFIRGKLLDVKKYSLEAETILTDKINGFKIKGYQTTYWKFHDLVTIINEIKTLSENISTVAPFVNPDVNLNMLMTRINRYNDCFQKELREGDISLSTIEQYKLINY